MRDILELLRRFSALLVIASLGLTLIGSIWVVSSAGLRHSQILLNILAAIIAAIAAMIGILVSRRLSRRTDPRRVFLVYARQDLRSATKIADMLREKGLHPWMDINEISGGQVWSDEIKKGLEESAAAIVLISRFFQESKQAQNELRAAMNTIRDREKNTSAIVPVRLDDSQIPHSLSHIHSVDISDEHGLERVAENLAKLAQ